MSKARSGLFNETKGSVASRGCIGRELTSVQIKPCSRECIKTWEENENSELIGKEKKNLNTACIVFDEVTDKRFESVSMNGRMAYVIMCVEAFLAAQYPEKDWRFVVQKLWKATSTNWDDWSNEFSAIIPDVLLQYDKYDSKEFGESMTEDEFLLLQLLYSDISEGIEDDPSDEVNYILNKPYEMAMVYEGTMIGDGQESIDIITKTETILKKHGIPLPDYTKVLFSSRNEQNGWGNDFDGSYLSILLNEASLTQI